MRWFKYSNFTSTLSGDPGQFGPQGEKGGIGPKGYRGRVGAPGGPGKIGLKPILYGDICHHYKILLSEATRKQILIMLETYQVPQAIQVLMECHAKKGSEDLMEHQETQESEGLQVQHISLRVYALFCPHHLK